VPGPRLRRTAVLIAVVASLPALAACSSSPAPPVSVDVTLRPARPASPSELADSARILQRRLTALRFTAAHVRVAGDHLVAAVTKTDAPGLAGVVSVIGALRVRRVLAETTALGNVAPSPTAAGGHVVGTAGPAPGSAGAQLARVRRAFLAWSCATDVAPTHGADATTDYIVACSPDGRSKFLLAPADLTGADIKTARAAMDTVTKQWLIVLTFTTTGASSWQHVTGEVAALPKPPTCGLPHGCNGVAFVLDGKVESAPFVAPSVAGSGITGGVAQITGQFTGEQAESLADILSYGALPVAFSVG
jgi:hypothetical protein